MIVVEISTMRLVVVVIYIYIYAIIFITVRTITIRVTRIATRPKDIPPRKSKARFSFQTHFWLKESNV